MTVDSSARLRRVARSDRRSAAGGVVIDFRAARYLDTSAIATLLEAATLGVETGVTLGVIGFLDGLTTVLRHSCYPAESPVQREAIRVLQR